MNKTWELLPIQLQLSMVLNEIITELGMSGTFLDLSIGLKKGFDAAGISRWFHTATSIVIEELQVQISLILDDQRYTCFYDPIESFLAPKISRPRTIANFTCKTPKSLSMSLRYASCAFANSACFLVAGFEMVFTNIDQEE